MLGSPFKVTVLPASVLDPGGLPAGVPAALAVGSGASLSRSGLTAAGGGGGGGSVDMAQESSSRLLTTSQTTTQRSAAATTGAGSRHVVTLRYVNYIH